jgi:tetratricopeptide (TPR) repeat protein
MSAPPTTDRWGVAVTTADAQALYWWDQAVAELVAFAGDPARSARTALDADAGFAEARAFCAYIELYAQTTEGLVRAGRLLDADPPEHARAGAEGRGELHLRAARAWSTGALDEAAHHLEAALVADPHDLLALRVAQDLYFFLGDGRSLRASAARVVRQWPATTPGWGYVQGMYSFGLEESGDYRRAEAAAGAALAADPADVWAVHTMAHIAEMEGRPDDGTAELLGRVTRWDASYFAVHHWWHLGLYQIAMGDYDQTVALYDTSIRAGASTAWLDLVDAASLLWRLALYGVDVSGRAAQLVGVLEPIAGSGISAFNDWHAVMVYELAGRPDLTAGVLASLDGAVGSNGRAVEEAGRSVMEAFARFAGKDFASAADILFTDRPRAQVLGGSHAQRDVIDLTLIAAAASAGDTRLVRALVDERLESRPGAAGHIDRLIEARPDR